MSCYTKDDDIVVFDKIMSMTIREECEDYRRDDHT